MSEIIISEAVKAKMKKFKEDNDIPEGRLLSIESKLLSNDLPKEGTFDKLVWHKMPNDSFSHLRIGVKGTDEDCSVSVLKTLGTENPVAEEKGLEFILKVEPINPQFSKLSQLELGAYLEGKKFKAEPVEVKIRKFEVPDPNIIPAPKAKQKLYNSRKECIDDADAKSVFKITLG